MLNVWQGSKYAYDNWNKVDHWHKMSQTFVEGSY